MIISEISILLDTTVSDVHIWSSLEVDHLLCQSRAARGPKVKCEMYEL